MDQPAVLAQLNDLPAPFRPAGNPYGQLVGALAAALALFTAGADATMAQVTAFGAALDGWIDVWGLLFGVPRSANEGNIPYAVRVAETVTAWVGTVPAIQVWLNLFAPGGTVKENASGLGYVVTLPTGTTAAQASAFFTSLGRIRPAGVPFSVTQGGTGLFLGTEAFLGKGTVAGAYLSPGLAVAGLNLAATTCSSQPLLPDLFLAAQGLAQPGLAPPTSPQGTWPPSVAQPSGAPTIWFWSNGGALTLVKPSLLPPSPAGLAAGAFWSNGGEVAIVGGFTPVSAPPIYLFGATLPSLQAVGSAGLPTGNPGAGSQQLWNSGNMVAVA
jgi:hypothetical protein